ncbi:Mitogen-activated protein kinase kinase kinase [Parasponia andersonii]|uniref:non-specific serine/threonine protein kinase n=1 Tax=Parasponia andersonii TaxID=3476 RepID=A0A2P5DSY8_PARAD|nr:Mitogen-activated protein kinase kinase kinase [Parasponia andersonii]
MVQMASLGSLNLSDNFISGSIPPSFCSLQQLRHLYLSHNRLSGKFPVELTRCSLLMLLDLSYNHFEGPVSPQIGNFRNLALSLNLSSNHFQGNIPETIQNLILLEEIDFSRHNFSCVIPSSIERCISLKYSYFSNNIIQGPIPESLKLITDLESLDLTHNQLNGTIPTWIGNSQMIKFLNLSYNRLSGEVPKPGRFRFFNRSSFLGNMGLCGGTTQMDLPPCEVQHHKHKTKKKLLYVIVTVILGCMLLLWVAFIIWYLFLKQKYRKQDVMLTAIPNIHGTSTYTERELEVATAGFNEANLLGTGSFGSVYKAIMDDGRTTVAVKVLHEETVRSYKSLKRECEILSKIKHRNLVGMTGLTMNPQFRALVLEVIPNGKLEQHLYPGGLEEETCELTLKERLSIGIDVANGLEYLQEGCPTQVVHCDMKPQNVLLDNDMVAHITDFGIGKLLLDRPNDQASSIGFLRGSIGYIPPEYGQGSGVSVKGDTYSFDVVLLEMFTRKRPTSGMFSDGLDLRKWVVSSFENDILTVVDVALKNDRQA